MNKKTLELIKNLKVVDVDFIRGELHSTGYWFYTGSFHFRMMTKDSDIDIVIRKDDVKEYVKYLVDNGGIRSSEEYPDNDSRQSVYIKSISNVYNFIVCNKSEYNVWKSANDMFMILADNPEYHESLKKKEKRVFVFEQLRNIINDVNKEEKELCLQPF
jgi:hypothetical protein